MARGSAEEVLFRFVPALYRLGAAGGLSDGQLLERFAQNAGQSSELAFEAIMERHGPMVLRVCRQVLGPGDDAHDAFQATFLVLVRKAGSIRRLESAASWLYGVAYRVAQHARVDRARRKMNEKRKAELSEESIPPNGHPEPWPELHEEIARLPEKYRHPVVLCYFEGLSTELAAERLGCPRGTVLSRLARGRERLRTRLVRRGLAPAVALLAAAEAAEAASVPPALTSATLALAQQFQAGRLAATSSALAAVSLAKGALWSMSLAKLKTVSAVVLALAVLVGVPVALAQQRPSDENAKKEPKSKPAGDPTRQSREDPRTPQKGPEATAGSEEKAGETIARIAGEQADLEIQDIRLAHIKEQLLIAMARADRLDRQEPADPDRPGGGGALLPQLQMTRDKAHKEVDTLQSRYREATEEVTRMRSKLDLVAKPGDRVQVEVLVALPGRPISGARIVGPDGEMSLGFYGEIQVAGLTNRQMKVKVIEHLRRCLKDEVLGLVEADPSTGILKQIAPADSDRVYVEIDLSHAGAQGDKRLSAIEDKIDKLINELARQNRAK